MTEVSATKLPRLSEVTDQLDRASLSALLNTAEGNGKRQLRQRAKFFDDARGSATECAACLDALTAKGACDGERTAEGKMLLLRIVAMLTRLVDRFSEPGTLREEPTDYRVGDPEHSRIEDEDEDENLNVNVDVDEDENVRDARHRE